MKEDTIKITLMQTWKQATPGDKARVHRGERVRLPVADSDDVAEYWFKGANSLVGCWKGETIFLDMVRR
jgi:hypothetical protein